MDFKGGSEWFWENYSKCFQWIDRHNYAHWKSTALSLNYERDALRSYCQDKAAFDKQKRYTRDCNVGFYQDRAAFDKHQRYTRDCNDSYYQDRAAFEKHQRYTRGYNDCYYQDRAAFDKHQRYTRDCNCSRIHTDTGSHDIQHNELQARKKFVRSSLRNVEMPYHREVDRNSIQKRSQMRDVSERDDISTLSDELDQEVVEFFKKSMKHQIERRKISEADGRYPSTIDSLDPEQEIYLKSPTEMRMIYGESAPMIQGMETAMQLSFERKCEKFNPVLWPGLPLNI